MSDYFATKCSTRVGLVVFSCLLKMSFGYEISLFSSCTKEMQFMGLISHSLRGVVHIYAKSDLSITEVLSYEVSQYFVYVYVQAY